MEGREKLRVLAILSSAVALCVALGTVGAEDGRIRGAFLGEERADAERLRKGEAAVGSGSRDQVEEEEEAAETTEGGPLQMVDPRQEHTGVRGPPGRVEREADWNREAEEKGEPAEAEREAGGNDEKPERMEGPFEEAEGLVPFGGSGGTDLRCFVKAVDQGPLHGYGIHYWDGKHVEVEIYNCGSSAPGPFTVGVRLAGKNPTEFYKPPAAGDVWLATKDVDAPKAKTLAGGVSITVYVPWIESKTVQLPAADDETLEKLFWGADAADGLAEQIEAQKKGWPAPQKIMSKVSDVLYVAAADTLDDVAEGKAGEDNNVSTPFHLGIKVKPAQILTFDIEKKWLKIDEPLKINAKVVGETGWKLFYVEELLFVGWRFYPHKKYLIWEGPQHNAPFPKLGPKQFLTCQAPFTKATLAKAMYPGSVRVVLYVWDSDGNWDLKHDSVLLEKPALNFAIKLRDLINQYRSGKGKNTLGTYMCQGAVAQMHSDWMKAKGYGYFYDPGGKQKNDPRKGKGGASLSDQCKAAGCQCSAGNVSFKTTPEDVMKEWKNHPTADADLLGPHGKMGIGTATDGKNFYTTVVFAN